MAGEFALFAVCSELVVVVDVATACIRSPPARGYSRRQVGEMRHVATRILPHRLIVFVVAQNDGGAPVTHRFVK